jgi:hypothetical protein
MEVPATDTHDDSSFLSPGLCLGIAQPGRSEEFGALPIISLPASPQLACGQGAAAEQLAAATVSEVKA